MFGSSILEVAIGLAFIYLLLSLLCSVVNEMLVQLFGIRAKHLKEGITNLIDDAKFVEDIYGHGLIQSLKPKVKKDPSYIPAKTFSAVLFDKIGLIVPADAAGEAAARQASIEKLLLNAPGGKLKRVLTTFLKQTNNDIAKTQTLVENWFDDSMTSLSEWYKTTTKIVLLGIGFATCVLMNADTINIVKVLSKNDQMRAAIVAQSQVIVNQEKPLEDKKQAIKELTAVELPIGYDFEHKKFNVAVAEPWKKTDGLCLLGWLFSAGAVSLGAPFWFDMLNKLVSIKPKGEEKKKDDEKGS